MAPGRRHCLVCLEALMVLRSRAYLTSGGGKPPGGVLFLLLGLSPALLCAVFSQALGHPGWLQPLHMQPPRSPEREQSLSCSQMAPSSQQSLHPNCPLVARCTEGGGAPCDGNSGSSVFGFGALKGLFLGALASVLISLWCKEHLQRGAPGTVHSL